MIDGNGADWGDEYQAAFQVADLARDPDDFRVTRQSKTTVGGILMPVSIVDRKRLERLFAAYEAAFHYYHGLPEPIRRLSCSTNPRGRGMLTAAMEVLLKRAARRTTGPIPGFDYLSIEARDYTIFIAPHVEPPVISIHTRPERCKFLAVLRFPGTALGESLGRMRVMRPTDQGVYPVTIRTKWRALTNKVEQEEVRDAYQRLIHPTH